MDADLAATIRRLDDEDRVKKLVMSMSIGMDLRDRDLFRAAWAEEIDLDVPPLGGDALQLSGHMRADDYADNVMALLGGFLATQHVSTNHVVEVDGDRATCRCYTFAKHVMRGDSGNIWFDAGAMYKARAARLPEGWRLVGMSLRPLWHQGDRGVWPEVTRRAVERRAQT